MPEKNLEDIIGNIANREKKEQAETSQINKLKELINKQKKIIEEKDKLLEEQQNKIQEMFDIPADTEELQKLIGIQKAQIDEKDQKMEHAYSKIAQLEQEVKGAQQTQGIMSKNFEDTFQQIGELKSDIAQKNAALNVKENEISNLNVRITELQKVNEENQKAINELNEKLTQVGAQSIDEKARLEAKLKEEIFAQKDEMVKNIKSLEAKLMEKELNTKETQSEAKGYQEAYEDLKQKYSDLIAKFDQIKEEEDSIKKQMEILKEQSEEDRKFREENEGTLTILGKLKKLMDKDPFFQIFWIIWDVGEAEFDKIKNAIGVPMVTAKKYINSYIDSGIFQMSDDGKISFVDR